MWWALKRRNYVGFQLPGGHFLLVCPRTREHTRKRQPLNNIGLDNQNEEIFRAWLENGKMKSSQGTKMVRPLSTSKVEIEKIRQEDIQVPKKGPFFKTKGDG